jgi:hypothetical protein
MHSIYDWSAVQEYHDQGHGFVDCSRRFGLGHTAWRKAILRGALRVKPTPFVDRRRRYNWAAVQAHFDSGHTYAECVQRFGFTADTWRAAIKRGELRARTRALSLELMMERRMSRGAIKRRLLELSLLEERCSRCGVTEWRGRPLQNPHRSHQRREGRLAS